MSSVDLGIPKLRPGRELTRAGVVATVRRNLGQGYTVHQIAAGFALAGYEVPLAALIRIERDITRRRHWRQLFPRPKKEVKP